MRVLITGAAGFIGSHLHDRYQAADHKVVGLDNFLTGRNGHNEVHPIDVTDRKELYHLANELEPDLIFHCAASYSSPDAWHRDTDTNVAGAINVANVAQHHDARVVYFQTSLPPVSSYAISKIAGEGYLRLCEVPLLVVKLANVYGPRNLSGPIPTFTRKLMAGEVCQAANTYRDFVYIDTLIGLLEERVARGDQGTVTVHTGRKTPIIELYSLVAEALAIDDPTEYVNVVDAPAGDVAEMRFDGAPVLDVSLRFGIRETVAWYQEHGVGETYTHLTVG